MVKVYYDCLGEVQMDSVPKFVLRGEKMKVKTTFYNHKHGSDYDPVLHVVYPKNRADQLSYQPTAKLVDQMFKTGQMLQASKQYYDFPDGKDDGREPPVDRNRGIELPEISQAMNENEARLSEHENNIKAMARKGNAKKSAGDTVPPPESKEGANAVSN